MSFLPIRRSFLRPVITSGFALGLVAGIVGTTTGASVLGSSIFKDVPKNAFYDAAVGDMYERGVIKGYNASEFGPDDYVTRGQVAVMMKRLRDDLLSGGVIASSKSSAGSSASVYVNPRGTFQFNAATYTVREGSGDAALTVTRTNGNQGEVTVQYTITAGSATKGSDFAGETGTLTFADKQTSKVLTVGILNDSTIENDETFTVTITDTGRAAKGSPATAIVTITDDDGASSASTSSATGNTGSSSGTAGASISLSAATYAITEAGGTLTVTVQRTGTTSGTAGVTYATGGGSAVAGSDYTTTNGTLSFGEGETTKTISIPIIDNTSIQGNKTFDITLSSPTGGAALGTQKTATVSIVDDENESMVFGTGSLKFAKSDYVFDEEDRTALITVQRTGGARHSVNVTIATANLTAIATLDYTPLSTTLTFAPYETSKVIAIPIVEDATNEEDEVFTVSLSNPTNGAELLSPSTTSVTITD